MCGLVGVVGNLYDQDGKVLRHLMYADTLRGWHSTGMLLIDTATKYDWEKMDCNAYEYWEDGMLAASLQSFGAKSYTSIMVHNRYATVGAIKPDNAHPFEFGDYVVMHNGTLKNTAALCGKYKVDSEHIPHTMHKKGMIPTLEMLEGEYALAIYNTKKEVVTLARNKERPLFYTKNKGRDVWYYASEELMLEWILTKHNVNFEDIRAVPVGKTVNFKLNGAKAELSFGEFTPKMPVIKYHGGYTKGAFGFGKQEDTPVVAVIYEFCPYDHNVSRGEVWGTVIEGDLTGENVCMGGVKMQDIPFDDSGIPYGYIVGNAYPYGAWSSDAKYHRIVKDRKCKIVEELEELKEKEVGKDLVPFLKRAKSLLLN